jgi:hypothetical protein
LGQKKVFHHSKWRKYLFDKVLMFFVSGKIVNGHSLEKKRNKLKMRTDNKEKKKKKKKKKKSHFVFRRRCRFVFHATGHNVATGNNAKITL